MAAEVLDLQHLSSYCSVPQNSLEALLDTPTVELVRALLQAVEEKARQHEEVESDNFRLNVELENAVRGREAQERSHKNFIAKTRDEQAELRQKLETEERSRAALQTDFDNLKSATSSSAEDIASLETRISSLESTHRDTVSLLESKNAAYDSLTVELGDQHKKTIELRREISTLEQSVQSAKAEVSTAKFREQGLQQEIEHLKRNNDWFDTELKTKSSEHAKYRKEKSSRIAELQRQNDDLSSTVDTLNRTEKTLRTRLDEVGQKADDAFSRIQQLEEDAARKEEAFGVELSAANRLAELTRNSADTERQRQQELQDELEAVREDASQEIGRLAAECTTEHEARETAEQRIQQLEVDVERLEADIAQLQDQGALLLADSPVINGSITPRQMASRGVSPSPAKLRGNMTLTQLYSEKNELKSELAQERRKNVKLSDSIDEMMQELESRHPEFEELRAEHARLETEITEMSTLVDTLGKERDQAVKDARRQEGQVEARAKEGHVLRQQLRDMSSQIKVLLMEIHLRQKGLEDLSAERHLQLERFAEGQIDEDNLDSSTDTDRFISQNLVTFRSVVELQEQNSKLLKVTRELGDRMEREEAGRKQSLEAAQSFEDLKLKHSRLVDEAKALVTQAQSYMRERDTFKKMLFSRGKDPDATITSSVNGEAPATPDRSMLNSIGGSPNAKDMADYAKLLKDMQAHFDAYRQETSTDRSTLKQQVDGLSKSNSELRGEVARSSSQVALAQERYTMLQENYGMLKSENSELQKRSQFFSDNAAKQEMRTQQVAEDLVEARSLADSMRNETSNLKAEKEFWKGVEKRLNEENGGLRQEQSRLNSLAANLQNLLNEREHADGEARRRLQTQVDSLERELHTTKQQLTEEVEDNKRMTSRREYDNHQNQKRIDDLITSLGSTREELAAARTKRDDLQNRVDELTIELRSAEERIAVLHPAPIHSSSPVHARQSSQGPPTGDPSGLLSQEQDLAIQISELRRDLDLAKGELDSANAQIEQYKSISQSSEEELASMNETHDLYRQDMDRLVDEKDAKIRDLESRIADISAELSSTNIELSELRTAQAENARRMDEQKTTFEAETAQLKDRSDRHASAAHFYQEDLKAQAEIAQQAQQNYENELVKHADAAKSLQKVRSEYNQLKIEVVEIKTEADSAKTNLAQNEESWVEIKRRYEKEILDLKDSKESLNTQNNRLHKQLDDVSTQIANLQKRPAIEGPEDSGAATTTVGMENLQEVIRYLRREKEIVDVQHELSSQEARRLKQQLEYRQTQLDEARLRLNQQRRLEEESERTSLNHNKLMETINELSTFRESNVTLRNETRQVQAALALKSQQIEELLTQVEPLQAEVRDLKNEIETQAGEATLLKEDRERWQQRTQDILQKYDRIDPAEMEALKNSVRDLESQRDRIDVEKSALQEQYDNVSKEVTEAQEQGTQRVEDLRQKLTEQFKNRSKQLSGRIAEKDQALQTVLQEKLEIEQRLSSVIEELENANAEKANIEQKFSSQAQSSKSRAQSEGEEGQVDEAETAKPTSMQAEVLHGQLAAAENKAREEGTRSAALQKEVTANKTRIVELESQLNEVQTKLDSVNQQLADARKLQQQDLTDSIPAQNISEEVTVKLREDLAQARQELETLKATATVSKSLSSMQTEDGEKPIPEQLTEQVELIRAELETRHNERLAQLEENFANRTNSMKAQLQSKLTEGKERHRQVVAAEHEQEIQRLTSEHQQQIENLNARHHDDIEELKRQEEAKFSHFKDSWIAEHPKTRDGASESKAETQASRPIADLTEAEAKAFVTNNQTVRRILRSHVAKQVEVAKEAITTQIKEEHEKEIAERIKEAQSKANAAKEQAISMEAKKYSLKSNVVESQLKTKQAQMDVVKTAAAETPSRAVAEVWAIAKVTKAAAKPQQQQQQIAKSIIAQPATASNAFEGSNASGQASQPPGQTTQATNVSNFGKSSSFGQPNGSTQSSLLQGQKDAPVDPLAQSASKQGLQSQKHKPSDAPEGQSQVQDGSTADRANQTGEKNDTAEAPASKLDQNVADSPAHPLTGGNAPQRPSQNTNNPFGQGTGPAALKNLQQSGLPVARGSSHRGRGNQRGRAQGRGGAQSVDTAQVHPQGRASPQGRNSPVGANLNPTAKQFVPGNKRPREDGPDSGHGNSGSGKRIRGGAGGL